MFRQLKIIVIIVLLADFIVPVQSFAQPSMSDGMICETLGVLRGTGDGLTEEYLARRPQRYQVAILFLRLQDLEEEAVLFRGTENFSDVSGLADWQFAPENKAVLGYLHAHPELGFIGYPDGTYRPKQEISAMEYYKVMLTALGYEQGVDFEWGEDLIAFAAGKGLYEAANVTNFTISNLATATREALMAEVKGTGKKLIEKLVEEGAIDMDTAIEAGIYEEHAFEVESVTAENLAEIMIRFSLKLDEGTVNTKNFTIDGREPAAAILEPDGKTVKLEVNKNYIGENGVNYRIGISKNILSAGGTAFEKDHEKTLTIIDNNLPGVEEVCLTGPRSFEIKFSEPIKESGVVRINGGQYGCRIEDIRGVANKARVRIYSTELPEGDYSLEISGFVDFAGFAMDPCSMTLSYTHDVSPITAEVLEEGQTRIKIKFNKEVGLKSGEENTYFYHTFPMWNPNKVLTDNNTVYTLYFDDYPVKEGSNNKLVVKAEGTSGERIEDTWGNTLQADIVLSVTVSSDKTPPSVKQIAVIDQRRIEVMFSEDVNGAGNKANYVIEDTDGKRVGIGNAQYDAVAQKAIISFNSTLEGNYTITVKDITDGSVEENSIKTITLGFLVPDLAPPDHTKVEVTAVDMRESDAYGNKDIIYVKYPEKMASSGVYSVLDAENYLLDGSRLPAGSKLEFTGTAGEMVKITLPDASYALSGKRLTIGKVADINENTVSVLSFPVAIRLEEPPAVTEAVQVAADRIEFTVNKALESVSPEAFIFDVSGTDYVAGGIARYYNDNGVTTVEVVLSSGLIQALREKNPDYGYDTGLTVSEVPGVRLKVVGRHIISETGMNAMDIESEMAAGDPVRIATSMLLVKDGWSPSLDRINALNNVFVDTSEFYMENDDNKYDSMIVLDFTEDIAGGTGSLGQSYAHDLIIRDENGNALVPGNDYVTYANGGDVFVVIPDVRVPLDAGEEKYTIEPGEAVRYIRDKADNLLTPFKTRNIE